MSVSVFVNQSLKMIHLCKRFKNRPHQKLVFDLIRQVSSEAKSEETPNKKKFVHSKSFIKNLYLGQIETTQVFPFPDPLNQEQKDTVRQMVEPFERFLQEVNHPDKNDADEEISPKTLDGLWEIGVFALQVPTEFGGTGLNNTMYCRMIEVVGKHDLSVGICLGAHQSIGYKGILLFGTPEQKAKYLPIVSTGKKYAAFCLTEPTAGSDAASIKSRAEPSADGSHFILNGSKIWISNGGFAEILTVFAQTPVKDEATGKTKDAVTAFIVERKFGGVTSGPPEKKMGIKASNTTEVFFDNVKIPKENVLGKVGDGFKVAMNILNNGRFGMSACLAGTMKAVTGKAIDFANQRTQFGRKLEAYSGVQEKLARMATYQYVTESLAYMISGNMDNGFTDYQLEAAISKCFASEVAWYVTDEAIQIMGGMGFMRQSGLERVLRDLRIFRIFEGTNDILRLFVVLTGIQHLQQYLMNLQSQVKGGNVGSVVNEFKKRISRTAGLGLGLSFGDLVHPNLSKEADVLCKCVERFGAVAESLLLKYKKEVINQQCYLNRLSQATMDLYSMSVVLSRCSTTLQKNLPTAEYEERLTKLWCHDASQRALNNMDVIKNPDYEKTFENVTEIAKLLSSKGGIVQTNPLNL